MFFEMIKKKRERNNCPCRSDAYGGSLQNFSFFYDAIFFFLFFPFAGATEKGKRQEDMRILSLLLLLRQEKKGKFYRIPHGKKKKKKSLVFFF